MKKQANGPVDVDASNRAIWDRHHAAAVGNFLMSAAAGAGGMGLFHMLRRTKKKLETQFPSQKVDYDAIASAPYLPPAEPEKLAEEIGPLSLAQKALFYGMPAAGAGIGAYLNARNTKGNKLRAALSGAAMGGGLGLAGGLATTNFGKLVREAPFSPPPPQTESYGLDEGLFGVTPRWAAVPAGLAAGGYLAHKMMDGHDEKKKEQTNVNAIQNARQEYFDALLADEKAAAALDSAFEKLSNGNGWGFDTSAWTGPQNNSGAGGINLKQNEGVTNAPFDMVSLGVALTALASMGAAGVGGTYMYNKTKDKSDSKQLARARLARERVNSLPGAWIDPREVANVKMLATGNQQAAGV
jgi:hypothetical protein